VAERLTPRGRWRRRRRPSEEEREMNGVAAAEQDVSVGDAGVLIRYLTPQPTLLAMSRTPRPLLPRLRPPLPVPEPPPPLTMLPLPAGAFRVGRLQVGPAVLGTAAAATVVFEGSPEGRPVAVTHFQNSVFCNVSPSVRPLRLQAGALSTHRPRRATGGEVS
jgi:hypothetical protein